MLGYLDDKNSHARMARVVTLLTLAAALRAGADPSDECRVILIAGAGRSGKNSTTKTYTVASSEGGTTGARPFPSLESKEGAAGVLAPAPAGSV